MGCPGWPGFFSALWGGLSALWLVFFLLCCCFCCFFSLCVVLFLWLLVVPVAPAPGGFFRACGVSRGSFRSFSRFCGSFCSLPVGPVAWLRPGRFVPPFPLVLVRFCRRGAVLFVCCGFPVFGLLGFPVRCWLLRGASWPWWLAALLAGVGAGGPAARGGAPGWRVARPGWPLRRSLRFLRPVRWRLVVAALSLFPAAAPAVVGFSGGRRLSRSFRPLVSSVVAAVLASGRSVAVGCAAGADLFVRVAAPGAVVFAVPGSGRRPASLFAARSVALVRSVAAGGPGSALVVFPASPCPAGLSPSAAPLACFCGLGSGSWASAAFAVGLGLPVVVFPCGFSALPPWGVWAPAGSGVWAAGFRCVA
jgi:hypothetical protein